MTFCKLLIARSWDDPKPEPPNVDYLDALLVASGMALDIPVVPAVSVLGAADGTVPAPPSTDVVAIWPAGLAALSMPWLPPVVVASPCEVAFAIGVDWANAGIATEAAIRPTAAMMRLERM